MWESDFVYERDGRSSNADASVCDSSCESASMSLSAGVKGGDGKSVVSISLMVRCFSIDFRFRKGSVARSSLALGPEDLVGSSTEVETGGGFGGGVHSTDVCNGPYNHVTSESLSLDK